MTALPKILVVGAHAGDAEITTGPVIAQHTQAGGEAVLLHVTLGERGHPDLSESAYAKQKREEAERAAALLGARAAFLPYTDGELAVAEAIKFEIADFIRAERPDIVITHWKGSFHKDHAACHDLVTDAVFYAGLPTMQRAHPAYAPRALYFAENWEDPYDYRPLIYVDTTDGHEQWLRAIAAYELFRGGLSSFPYRRYYEALATLRGIEIGVTYAKTFAVPVEAQRLKLKDFANAIPFPVTTGASIIRRTAANEPRP